MIDLTNLIITKTCSWVSDFIKNLFKKKSKNEINYKCNNNKLNKSNNNTIINN